MVNYQDGSEIRVGDSILFDKGRSSGQVVAVISEDLAEYHVREPGVLVKVESRGLVFIPVSRFAHEQVSLEQRGPSGFRWSGP